MVSQEIEFRLKARDARTRVLARRHREVKVVTSKKNKKQRDIVANEKMDGLTAVEELILYAGKNAHVDEDMPLKRKTANPQLLARLLELELEIIKKARERKKTRE